MDLLGAVAAAIVQLQARHQDTLPQNGNRLVRTLASVVGGMVIKLVGITNTGIYT